MISSARKAVNISIMSSARKDKDFGGPREAVGLSSRRSKASDRMAVGMSSRRSIGSDRMAVGLHSTRKLDKSISNLGMSMNSFRSIN